MSLRRKLDRNNSNNRLADSEDGTANKKAKTDENSTESLDLSLSNCCQADRSKYFPNLMITEDTPIDEAMLKLQNALNDALRNLQFKNPVEYVYNPLEYAAKCNETYIRKYCTNQKKLLFVGMNPGPYGMCQTGVPFGEIKSVRDWLGIQEEVLKPPVECPERPVLGFECTRSEVSGDRLWTLFKSICETPERMFANSFIYNYCPLAFLKSNGNNVTPSEIKNAQELEGACDKAYLEIINLLKPEIIIGIGRYAQERTNLVLKDTNHKIQVLYMPHPSPRAVNNNNWPEKARQFLIDNDLMKYFENEPEEPEADAE